MPALFLGDSAARAAPVSGCVEPKMPGEDGISSLCEVMGAGQVVSGVYDSVRRTLTVPCPASAKLSDQPESVNALVCSCRPSVGAAYEYIALLAAANGATVLLPRESATNASEIRVRPRAANRKESGANASVVAFARGSDPYTVLLEAIRELADKTGVQHNDVYTYALPLLDAVNRLRFDVPLAAAKSCRKLSSTPSLTSVFEQYLHEGILVQAGPGCSAKPLLQAPGLRVCRQGMSAPLGVRYSGMSVVYGTATGHVLAVMDTAAALKMAPAGGMRPLGLTSSGRWSGDADSPSAVSAGASAANSATPSPPMSRANSSCGDTGIADAVAALSISNPATPLCTPPMVLSGRSITAAPVIQLLAVAPPPGSSGAQPVNAGLPEPDAPTGAPAYVLASFALLGVKASGGRVGAVQCCRVMPASMALATAAPGHAEAQAVSSGPAGGISGLGLVVQMEVSCASAGTLLVFVEGPELESVADPSLKELAGGEGVAAAGPVRKVMAQGRAAHWHYNTMGGILSVELPPPAAAATGATHVVHVFM